MSSDDDIFFASDEPLDTVAGWLATALQLERLEGAEQAENEHFFGGRARTVEGRLLLIVEPNVYGEADPAPDISAIDRYTGAVDVRISGSRSEAVQAISRGESTRQLSLVGFSDMRGENRLCMCGRIVLIDPSTVAVPRVVGFGGRTQPQSTTRRQRSRSEPIATTRRDPPRPRDPGETHRALRTACSRRNHRPAAADSGRAGRQNSRFHGSSGCFGPVLPASTATSTTEPIGGSPLAYQ
jgi:hypothetical protein